MKLLGNLGYGPSIQIQIRSHPHACPFLRAVILRKCQKEGLYLSAVSVSDLRWIGGEYFTLSETHFCRCVCPVLHNVKNYRCFSPPKDKWVLPTGAHQFGTIFLAQNVLNCDRKQTPYTLCPSQGNRALGVPAWEICCLKFILGFCLFQHNLIQWNSTKFSTSM